MGQLMSRLLGSKPRESGNTHEKASNGRLDANQNQSQMGDRMKNANVNRSANKEQELQTQDAREVNIVDPREDDIVIIVMGPTGSGKSTFVCCASGTDMADVVGHGLKSHTTKVNPVRFQDKESGRSIVLVDTPGFNNKAISDGDVLKMVSQWLGNSYKEGKLVSAILYLHQITENRMSGTPLKNLRMFQKLCGSNDLDKVYFTTTMWDEVEEDVGKRRLEELKSEFWKTMINQGSRVVCCRNDDDSPRRLVGEILGKGDGRGVWFQGKMDSMAEGEDAIVQKPHEQMEELLKKQTEIARKIAESKKAGSDPEVLLKLQDLEREIDFTIRQMKEGD